MPDARSGAAVGVRWSTLSEIALSADYNWPDILLRWSGGLSDRLMDGNSDERACGELGDLASFDVSWGSQQLASYVHSFLVLSPELLVKKKD